MNNIKLPAYGKQKVKKKLFSLGSSISVSLLISLLSHILFIYVLTPVEISLKYIGIIVHSLLIVVLLLTIRATFFLNSSKTSYHLKFLNNTFLLLLIPLGIFYGILLTLMKKDNADINQILFFLFSVIISGLFHGLFITAINSYLGQLSLKPLAGTIEDSIDEDLKNVMLRNG